jgi:hypothetical protein
VISQSPLCPRSQPFADSRQSIAAAGDAHVLLLASRPECKLIRFSAALVNPGIEGLLCRERQRRTEARLFLFRGRAGQTVDGEDAHQGRGKADRGELCEIARAVAEAIAGAVLPTPLSALDTDGEYQP